MASAKRPGPVPDGVCDPVARVVYVRNEVNGIDAVNLDNGKLLWRTKAAALPLLVDQHLLALAPARPDQVPTVLRDPNQPPRYGEEWKCRFVLLDTAKKGKRVWQSEEVPHFDAYEGQAFRSRVWAWKEENRVHFRSWGVSWYAGGMVPTDDMMIPTLRATVGELDLASGKFKVLEDETGKERRSSFPRLASDKEDNKPFVLSPSLTEAGAVTHESGSTPFQTETFVRGSRAVTMSFEPRPEGGLLLWTAKDRLSGKEIPSHTLFQGRYGATAIGKNAARSEKRDFTFVVPARSPHVFVIMDNTMWVFDPESGLQLGSGYVGLNSSRPEIVGARWFSVVHGEIDGNKGQIPRHLVCSSAGNGQELWRHALLPASWSPPPP